MILKCGHSICMKCVDKYPNHLICPKESKCSEYADIKDFSPNLDLLSYLKKQKEMQFCTDHPGETVNFFCIKDESYICQKCLLEKHENH